MSKTATSPVTITFAVSGMTCGGCESHVRRTAEALAGVRSVTIPRQSSSAVVTFDPQAISASEIGAAIIAAGYAAIPTQAQPETVTAPGCGCGCR